MSQRWVVLTCILSFGVAGTCHAAPAGSADTVYIDGLPCNRLCQSYLAWSRSVLRPTAPVSAQPSSAQRIRHPSTKMVDRATGTRGARPQGAAPVQTARRVVPASVEMPSAQIPTLQPAGKADVPATIAAEPSQKAGPASDSSARTLRDQVAAATALAERLSSATAPPSPELKLEDADLSNHTNSVRPNNAETTAPAPSSDSGPLVALLMTRSEISAVSDLADKEVAIEDSQFASSESLRIGIAAAGAVDVQLSDSHTKAIDRLLSGEVPAAVLTLVSPEAAAVFPDIAGFKTFRIPLPAT
jgi:hypothetical protein